MSKRQLMDAIGKLERKLDRAEADNTSMMSDLDENRGKTEGKQIYTLRFPISPAKFWVMS